LPKFQVYKDAAAKFRFRLRADNNEIIAVGEAYEKKAGCLNGIKSIQKNSNAPVEDTTIKGTQKLSNPKYDLYKDAAGKFRFHLRAANGQIIADSEGYEKKADCLNGIDIVRRTPTAEIEDTTKTAKKTTETKTPSTPISSVTIIKTKAIATETAKATVPEIIETKTAETKATIFETRTTPVITIPPQVMAVEPLPQEGPDRKNEMIAELKKIRESLEKAPTPAPPKGLWNEFKDFLSKYKILGMAIAIVIGVYLGLLVQALVAGFLIPLIGLAIPGMSNLSTYFITILDQKFTVGDFLSALITFLIVALIVFLVVKLAKKWNIE
jgi:large conductance mechanosensitive channel protein